MFVFITLFGFAIFYNETDLLRNLGYLLGVGTVGFSDVYTVSMLYENGLLLIAALVCVTPLGHTLASGFGSMLESRCGSSAAYNISRVAKTVAILALFAVCTVRMVGDSYNPFIYFRF